MKFYKYEGTGNDFIIIDEKEIINELSKEDIKKICDRHFGIGSDGLIIHRMVDGLPFMDFYNPDGSKANMCGNGIRCYANFLKKYISKNEFFINTRAGLKNIIINSDEISVDMGEIKKLGIIHQQIENENFEIHKIDSGTDHIVVFTENFTDEFIIKYGKILEKRYDLFEKGTNVNFVYNKIGDEIKVKTWERGAGFTLSCGTGVVASAFVVKNILNIDKVKVHIKGGIIDVYFKGNRAIMKGNSNKVFEGEI